MAETQSYLPPLTKYIGDAASIAAATADDVRAAPGAAAKAGVIARGALASAVPVVKTVNDVATAPFRAALDAGGSFLNALVGGPTAPTLGLPALAAPAPATQQPVKIAPGTQYHDLVASSPGTPAPAAAAPAVAPATAALPQFTYRSDPVAVGMNMQAQYADTQRQAVLAAASQAAADGHIGNASARYMAALGALPHLSGTNNFAGNEAEAEAARARTQAETESNIRTTQTAQYGHELAAENVRRQLQPLIIGHEPNPDPTTRVIQPTIPIPGYGTVDKDGKVHVYNVKGEEQKPPTPPTRSEFITKNKLANPSMSPADLGREYDKKYPGKS